MNIFHCDNCQQVVFFENIRCVSCDHLLAYRPDVQAIGSLEPIDDILWRSAAPEPNDRSYRLCENYSKHNVCNWAIPADDVHALCLSCRLTRVIPELDKPSRTTAWFRLEAAKRRLIYSLLKLDVPLLNKRDDPKHGLAFEFLADPDVNDPEATPILTGHADGVITINLAEADDAEREKRRVQMNEPYRTVLGHFRHEVGHYYWDRLIKDSDRLAEFRDKFGDERQNYAEALQHHYSIGPAADWQDRFVSAYASVHPWEDWAETWAHYLHMNDTLETASVCGLKLQPMRGDEPRITAVPTPRPDRPEVFDRMIKNWLPLTYLLNNLNRDLGLPDGYPFILSVPVIEKLRFVHETVGATTAA